MKNSIIGLALVGATSLAGTTATAQDYYVSGFGGFTQFADDADLDGDVATPAGVGNQSVQIDDENGFTFGIAVGRDFGALGTSATLRGEIELSYSDQDADEVNFSGNGSGSETNVSGGIDTTRLFANAYADFETSSAYTPYIGAGIGLSRTDFDVNYGAGVELDDDSDNFAAQLIAGTSYDFGNGYSVFGDVRYIRDFDVESDRFAPTGAFTGDVSDDIDTVSVNVGVSFAF